LGEQLLDGLPDLMVQTLSHSFRRLHGELLVKAVALTPVGGVIEICPCPKP